MAIVELRVKPKTQANVPTNSLAPATGITCSKEISSANACLAQLTTAVLKISLPAASG